MCIRDSITAGHHMTEVAINAATRQLDPVSYTHLDVYKRQVWSCLPAFDGDPAFCALLSPREHDGGDHSIELEDFDYSEQAYLHNTAVLRTVLHDRHGGAVEIIDFAPRWRENGRFFRPVMPVSYTHLDVYKRQLECRTTRQPPCQQHQRAHRKRSQRGKHRAETLFRQRAVDQRLQRQQHADEQGQALSLIHI